MNIYETHIEEAMVKDSREGFHQFVNHETGEGYSSFEVFWSDHPTEDQDNAPGWYWWPCFPGCLPDGDPIGPFAGSIAAYYDAIEE